MASKKKKSKSKAKKKVKSSKKTKKEVAPVKVQAKKKLSPKKKSAADPVRAKEKPSKDNSLATFTESSLSQNSEVVITDAEGRRYCKVTNCDQIASINDKYCRYHYLLFWKKIQIRNKILESSKLSDYIRKFTAVYSYKFIELIKKDLRTERDFLNLVEELQLDESPNSKKNNFDGDLINEIKGSSNSNEVEFENEDY